MPWVYLDDHFPDHPKVAAAGGDAAWLFVCGLAYSKRYATDGAIPRNQVARLTDRKNPLKLAGTLVTVGLWETADDGFQVHDYSDWNRPAESRSEAGRKAAEARWHSKRNANGNANACDPHMPQDALSPFPIPIPAAASNSLTHESRDSADAAALSEAALNTIADRRMAASVNIANPPAYRKSLLVGLRRDYAEKLSEVDFSWNWTPETLAVWLEPAPTPPPSNFAVGSGRLPNWSKGES